METIDLAAPAPAKSSVATDTFDEADASDVRATSTSTGFATTRELVHDPSLQAEIDQLVQASMQLTILDDGTQLIAPTMDREAEGRRGYPLYQKLAAHISDDDAIALLRHENGAVRAYMADYVRSKMPGRARELLTPLYNDPTILSTPQGDRGYNTTVGAWASGRWPHR